MNMVKVNTITGKSLDVEASTVFELQEKIESVMGIPLCEQKLLCNGKIATDENLSDSVQLLVNLEGGAKGKKKKKVVKKTKKPHKHNKINLRILNYYTCDGEKVDRKLPMCKICPPGTFLAEHPDRLYCGRCHFTCKREKADEKAASKAKKEKKAPKEAPKEEAPAGKKGKKGKK